MKKIFYIFTVACVSFLLAVSVFANTELHGNIEYSYTISDDGKTATVIVSLDGYDKAKSMMITPEYDEDDLQMQRGNWLVSGALSTAWNSKEGNAIIAFEENTDINSEIFSMVFEIKGDVSALDDISCDLIVKSPEPDENENDDPPTYETDAPETQPPKVEVTENEPPEIDPPGTSAPETRPPVVVVPETERTEIVTPVTDVPQKEPIETDVPTTDVSETQPVVTDVPVIDASETEQPGTDAEVTDVPEIIPPGTDAPAADVGETGNVETKAPETNHFTNGDYTYDYDTEKVDHTGSLIDGYLWLVLLVGGVAAAGIVALVVGIVWVKKRTK